MNEMEDRIRFLQKGCKAETVTRYRLNFTQNKEIFYNNRNANLTYCKVPKAGSSYMTRVFLALKHPTWNLEKILKIQRSKVHVLGNKFATNVPLSGGTNDSVTFLVVRDPYSRLYSAYIDKIFLKTSFYHLQNEKDFVHSSLNKNNSECPRPVSFTEFLTNILQKAMKGNIINRHWSPIYLLCHPCHVKYDFVAKQHSLTRDIQYIFSTTNLSTEKQLFLRQLSRDRSLNDTVRGLLATYLRKRGFDKRKCADNKRTYLRRIWKTLHIQGLLRDNVAFPERKTIRNQEEFIRIVLDYVNRYPVSKSRSIQQRNKYLSKAYSRVSTTLMKQIQDVYSNDFLLFNYSIDPPVKA